MKAIIDLMIFIDVGIFAFGYAIELPFLKNTIRSVEPTWFGWFICLICYPPLNEAFFPLANYNLNATWPVWGEATRAAVTLIVALLWTNYTWASVALGFKASNLTNRGVVDTGPYRFVRHPAYVSKCTLWVLSCFFLGEGYGVNILFAIAVYTLRALTEERHLLRDPEYVAYRKRVRWMFCPGIV